MDEPIAPKQGEKKKNLTPASIECCVEQPKMNALWMALVPESALICFLRRFLAGESADLQNYYTHIQMYMSE
jgi:hypothetical protein